MRILVASSLEALSPYAHVINTVKMAQGFARLGHDVTLVCWRPAKVRVQPTDLDRAYGLTAPIRWVLLPKVWRLWRWRVIGPGLFAAMALLITLRIRPDVVFARDYVFPWLTSRLGFATVAESHAQPDTSRLAFHLLVRATCYPAFRLWVTISDRLARHYQSLGVPAEKLVVLPDGVDIALFERPAELPPSPYRNEGPNVAYIGHLYDYKGVLTMLEAAKLLPDVQFHLIGGWPEDIVRQRERAEQMGLNNVTLHGLKPQSELPPFLWHADVLLLPPSQHHPSAAWTSPLKLGEYLASGSPIVATDIPALRDWVTDNEVEFVSADDPKALTQGIRRVLCDKSRAEQLRTFGLQKAKALSYKRRADAILKDCGLLS